MLPVNNRTPVGPRRFAPKGNRPMRTASKRLPEPASHTFVADPWDPISCLHCSLPERNGRHQPPAGDA